MNNFEGSLARLPKSTEDALNRYLYHYEKGFIGPAADFYRLKSLTEAFVHKLRKVAPTFHREKLPTLINQAASNLLLNSSNTEAGRRKFHETHCYFLSILKDLKSSQPAGEVSFQDERERLIKRQNLFKRQLELKKKINQLEAADFDFDVIGDDEHDSAYLRTIRELDELRDEWKRVNLQIIHMEGEKLDEEPEFQLKVPKNSQLARLNAEQVNNLELQMITYYKEHNKKKTAMYVDKSIIDGMIEKLNVDTNQFTKVELSEMSKNALDAYKGFWRELDLERREKYHEELLKNKAFEPKEGTKFASPYDIPEEARRELDRNDLKYRRQFEELLEEYGRRQTTDDTDNIDDEEGDDRNTDDLPDMMSAIQSTSTRYARVKEEPRDDYFDEEGPGQEIYVSEETAEYLVDGQDISWSNENIEEERQNYERELRDNASRDSDDDEDDEQQQETAMIITANGHDRETTDSKANLDNLHTDVRMETSGNDTNVDVDDDDDDIECLGTIEPADKIRTLDVE